MAKKYLFVHQNFPAQFVHVAAALARQGNEVVALAIKGRAVPGVRLLRYSVTAPARTSAVEPARDFETKIVRALACADAMGALLRDGFVPDVVVAHPGWGEAMFCKDVWPAARLVIYAEFFYGTEDSDYGFDKELFEDSAAARARLRLKNTVHLHALAAADTIYTPTQWQRSKLPPQYRDKAQVMFDGIDTTVVKPDPGASVQLVRKQLSLTRNDEVITFVNRNLEPYRGFHVFMRALPEIMARRPKAHCLIVGRDAVSYGAPPRSGGSWRDVMLAQVGSRLPVERVHFLGSLPYLDYLRVLQVSACHVYLTYPFVLSWSCLEAMSAGCTVVGSDTGPVREVIQDGVDGLLTDFFDVAALAHRVVSVLDDREVWAGLGAAARQKVVAGYDLQKICLPGQLRILDPN